MTTEETTATATQGGVQVLRKIVNLTQHTATPAQVAAGVVDLEDAQRAVLQTLLTFEELPDRLVVLGAANNIAALAQRYAPDANIAMIGGAPFLMGALETALSNRGTNPIYAFSKRESVQETAADGSVRKTAVSRHIGFVAAGRRQTRPLDPVAAIIADIAALTARVSVEETTATPTAAVALREAREHLISASIGAELSQVGKKWECTIDARASKVQQPTDIPTITPEMAEGMKRQLADIPTITPEMAEEIKAAIEKRRAGRPVSPLEDIADAPCPECGAHAVSVVDDLAFDEMIMGAQGVVSVNIPNLTGIRCSKCGDYAFGADASKEIMRAVAEVESGVREPDIGV